ncbi:MAG: BTAD domain-containing putative transcriptional regulator [Chloroflexota bacterium]
MLDTVLKHAITPPKFEPNRLHRERLVDAIHANIPRKLIAIAAPPGYGKTTLLADFTAHTELPVCWVRLTEADTDVMRLASVLAASLQRRFRRLRNQPNLTALAGAPPAAIARAFADVIDAKVSETFVIAYDDIHLVNHSKPVLEFLDAFLGIQPDQVTTIAAGREVVDVSLARLMAEGSLAGMGPHDLALDRDELIALARQMMGVELSAETADRLLEETRGWITGVLLSGMLSGSGLTDLVQGTRPMVYEYLASVVLNRQPDDLRRFMLDSAVLPVMTAAACDHVLQRTDSDCYLKRLVRGGLFVTATDESPRTYEYHAQFRSFLLESLAGSDTERLHGLQVQAGSYLAEHGSPEHAVELYLQAGAVRKAAVEAERHAEAMHHAGRSQTLAAWAESLKSARVRAPRVFISLARALINQGDLPGAEEALRQARSTIAGTAARRLQAEVDTWNGLVAWRRGRFRLALDLAEKTLARLGNTSAGALRVSTLRLKALAIAGLKGDMQVAEALLRDAVRLAERVDAVYAQALALSDLSMIETQMGNSHEAFAASLRAHELLQGIGSPYPLAASFNNLAVDAYLQGRYVEAMQMFSEAAKNARLAASPQKEAVILLGQADLFADLDLSLQAAELYGQALALATQVNDNRLLRYGCVQSSVLHRRRGGVSLAHEWLRRAVALGDGGPPSASVEIQLAALEAMVSSSRARTRLQNLLKEGGGGLDAGERTLAYYFLAKAALVAGDRAEAQAELDQALAWAGGHGTEQALAGEIGADAEVRDFARSALGSNPVLSVVLHRIETMRAVAEQHREEPTEGLESAKLEVRALGQLVIRWKGKEVIDLKPMAREVLSFLADRQPVERDVVLETFWPHYNPGRQTSNLHTAVYMLRRLLGKDSVVQTGTAYSLNPDLKLDYDVSRFERAAEVAEGLPPGDPRKLFALTAALNTYGGHFLAEYASDWVIERRRSLEMRYLDLLASHADEAMIRDQPLKALATLRQALEIDPLRDDTNLRFIETLGRLGRRSELVAHYQRYVRLLAEELGLDPPEKIRHAYMRLIG